MSRKASREVAMKLLYQLDIQKEDRDDQISNVIEENGLEAGDKKYVLDIVEGTNKNKESIDAAIEASSSSWALSRISKVDLAILRLAVYEINFREDIPVSVSINEAVELAKKYSGDDSGSFVNGVLGKIAPEK
jgi:transcription antitermination factor NusB